MNTSETQIRMNRAWIAGVLDASARIYPNAVVIYSSDPRVTDVLRNNFGGSLVQNRLIVRGRKGREHLFEKWFLESKTRRDEIKAAEEALITGVSASNVLVV